MKLVGLMPVRNEQWCLGLSLRAALMWLDEIVVLNHASTDGTVDILSDLQFEHPGRVHLISVPEKTWAEMSHRQATLELARHKGATHIAMIDADEVLTGNLLGPCAWSDSPSRVSQMIEVTPVGSTLQLPWLALPRSIKTYLISGVWGPGQQVSMAFKDQPEAHWTARNGYDFHHRNPMGLPPGRFSAPLRQAQGGIMHLQFLSERRLRAKQALYQATEVLRWPGRQSPSELATMYGRAVYESDPKKNAFAPIPQQWWDPYEHLMKYLDLSDSEPWQETELKNLIAEHGRAKFAGLDLFEVA